MNIISMMKEKFFQGDMALDTILRVKKGFEETHKKVSSSIYSIELLQYSWQTQNSIS